MRVKLKKLHDNAVLPTKATSKDFCYDVVAVWEKEVAPNVWQYGLGFAYEIERGPVITGQWTTEIGWSLEHLNDDGLTASFKPNMNSEAHIINPRYFSELNISLDFRPRSSVWKTGMILSNCEGTLDEMYRGEVMAVFYHVMPDMPRYKVGDRIGQIKLGITVPVEFEFVDHIDTDTDRGTGGFGSTGR